MVGLRDYVGRNGFPGVILGLSGGIDSALSRRGRGRRAWARQGAVRDDAVANIPPTKASRMRRRTPACSAAAMTSSRSPRRGGARRDARRPARARPPENIQSRLRMVTLMALSNTRRRHAADHRQQERDERRLCHALRRHGGRLFGAQGRLQDDRVRALAVAQRQPARRRARSRRPGHAAADHRQAAHAPSFAPTRRTRTACRPMPCSTASSRRWSSRNCRSTKPPPRPAPSPRSSPTSRRSCCAPNTSAARPRRGSRSAPATSAATAATRSPTPSTPAPSRDESHTARPVANRPAPCRQHPHGVHNACRAQAGGRPSCESTTPTRSARPDSTRRSAAISTGRPRPDAVIRQALQPVRARIRRLKAAGRSMPVEIPKTRLRHKVLLGAACRLSTRAIDGAQHEAQCRRCDRPASADRRSTDLW